MWSIQKSCLSNRLVQKVLVIHGWMLSCADSIHIRNANFTRTLVDLHLANTSVPQDFKNHAGIATEELCLTCVCNHAAAFHTATVLRLAFCFARRIRWPAHFVIVISFPAAE